MQAFLHMGGVCSAAIQSENVVGYTTDDTGANNNFITAPFFSVGYTTTDIQDIKISDGGAGLIGWGTENFSIWEGLPTLAAGSEFTYTDPSMDPAGEATDYYWGDAEYNKASYSIAPGQGVVIDMGGDGAGLSISTAGQVPTEAVTFTAIANNNFTGNPFPAAIDIQNIKISDNNAGLIGWGAENFSIWEGLPTLAAGSEFSYIDPSMDPAGKATDYYWGDAEYNKA